MTSRVYKLQITRPTAYSVSYDWTSGSPVPTRIPLPARVDIVEAPGDTPDAACQMAAAQHGVALESVSLVLDDDGRPVYREYEEADGDARSLRGRARSGEDGFGR